MNNRKIILVEAEFFDDTGGWVVDQQFMDIMGSPFLLAHGLGEPVADAETVVQFPEQGNTGYGCGRGTGQRPGVFQALQAGSSCLSTTELLTLNSELRGANGAGRAAALSRSQTGV